MIVAPTVLREPLSAAGGAMGRDIGVLSAFPPSLLSKLTGAHRGPLSTRGHRYKD